jgi:uncharacterized repeat protein (TIGR03803 family)
MFIRRRAFAIYGTFLTALLVFSGSTAAQTPPAVLTPLYSFAGGSDGADPSAPVVLGRGGVLYGTTNFRGTANHGTVFSLTPPAAPGHSWTLTTLYAFAGGSDGADPDSGLAIGSGGVLYGVTYAGGNDGCFQLGCGTVFSLTPPATPGGPWTKAILHTFTGGRDGGTPISGVVMDRSEVLYGTTYSGGTVPCTTDGAVGCGTVFSLTPPKSAGGAWTEGVLHSFAGGTDGANPGAGGLTIGKNAELYGTTETGGITFECYPTYKESCGTVFSLTPPRSPGDGWTKTMHHSFAGVSTDGSEPYGRLVIDSDGALYGTTQGGGLDASCPGCGTVFSLKPPAAPGGEWSETVLYSLGGAPDGDTPWGGVVIGKGGVLYGTTYRGGKSCCGTVFSLTPPTSPGGLWTEAVLHSFDGGSDGAFPPSGLAIGEGGVLYGTTYAGGTTSCTASEDYDGCGTVFSLTP